jgi:hypothetical protein
VFQDKHGVELDLREKPVPIATGLFADIGQVPQEAAAVFPDAENVANEAHTLVCLVYLVL